MLRWRVQFGGEPGTAPILVGDTVLTVDCTDDAESLFAYDAATGTEGWHARIGDANAGSPVVVGGDVIVANRDRFV